MTASTTTSPPPALDPPQVNAATPPTEDVTAVADTFVELMRSFTRARARMLAAAAHDVEWSAHILLRTLATEGPMRSSALAERVLSDPSTVSRQIAALVKSGMVERLADPDDGRACLLVPTDKAADVLRDYHAVRIQHFERMLAEWSERDLRRFAALLERFTRDFEIANSHWLSDRAPRSTEGSPA